MVVAFVGFLGGVNHSLLGPEHLFFAGALGAVIVTWFTFLFSFVFIFAGAPIIESTHNEIKFTAPTHCNYRGCGRCHFKFSTIF
jgi:chromate transporter